MYHQNDLKYWLDYMMPTSLFDISIDSIGTKLYSCQKQKIIKLYNTDNPDVIIINSNNTQNVKVVVSHTAGFPR